jgi:site-specific recombinase XerD
MNQLIQVDLNLPLTLQNEAAQAKKYLRARHSDSTRRAYASDVLAFEEWTRNHNVQILPASPESVVLYLTAIASQGLKPATLRRRLAAIRHLHRESGFPSPTDTDLVSAAMSGIKRSNGSSQRQVAPATADVVENLLKTCESDLRGKRDRLLLALGFGGAFRRSELAALRVEDIEVAEFGLRVSIRRSKTDQESKGEIVPVLDGARLQVKSALKDWLNASGFTSGALFRGIGLGDKVLESALTDRTVANIIKARASQAGLDATLYSGHSLRAGFLTTAAASGASLFKMMDVSRHKKVDTVRGYIRQAELFKDHAGSSFM